MHHASPTRKAESIVCTIEHSITDDIVAQLLFEHLSEDEESDLNFEVKAMSMFHLNETDSDCPYYSIEIANSILFQLIVLYVGCGTSV
jgi:hypothetical protein